MLTARTDTTDYIEAAEAARGVTYVCRDCRAPVVLKKGALRIAHFAHRPDAICAFGSGMSLAHLAAQRQIAEALRSRGVGVQLEAILPSLAGDRRVDVLAWPPTRLTARVAVEVQASDITVEAITARTLSYQTEAVAPLWLRLYDFGRFEDVQALPHRGTVWIEGYRARAWERWVHDQLGGRMWILDEQTGMVWRAAFIRAHTYRELSTWYGPGGEEQWAGGDWREIVQWVDLELEGPFRLSDIALNRGQVVGADGQTRLAAWFVAQGQPDRPGEASVRRRFEHGHHGIPNRVMEVSVDDRWIPAVVEEAPSDWRSQGVSVRPTNL
ncbi:competence protein CoiA [Brevundimonas naejangsanensis]|uniref:competence protein CoiA n=1 Tax=Brevundimonas naejangsanensis TaxID=588932 RepID=UPI003207CCF7